MLVSSSAPLPNNTLTPIPQGWVDKRNLQIGLLSQRVREAQAITDCYTAASSLATSSGSIVAAQAAQVQANLPSTSPASNGGDSGTPPASASGVTPSSRPNPIVVSDDPVFSWTPPGTPAFEISNSCHPNKRTKLQGSVPAQPKILMPQDAPVLTHRQLTGLGGIAPLWGTYDAGRCNGASSFIKNNLGILALGALVLYAATRK